MTSVHLMTYSTFDYLKWLHFKHDLPSDEEEFLAKSGAGGL